MASLKTKLKAARDALHKKNFQVAKDTVLEVLSFDPDNYNANVFLGLASLELGEYESSEQAYRKAIQCDQGQVLAWQGLSKFYQRRQRWDEYADTLLQLATMFAGSGDASKCAESVQNLIELRRSEGSRDQVIDALSLLLPGSPLYPTLSTLPAPDHTNPTGTATFSIQTAVHNFLPVLEELVALVEKGEQQTIKNEIDKRRLRLSAPSPEKLRRQVLNEVMASSRLPKLYEEILNHPCASDSLRRQAESKLIYHKNEYLHALPACPTKSKIAAELDELVNGVVLLGIPDELAWLIFFDGKDCEAINDYGLAHFQQMMRLFPSLPLTSLLRSYFAYMNISLERDDDDDSDGGQIVEASDAYDALVDCLPAASNSIPAHRIVAEAHLRELDYEAAIKVADIGVELVKRAEFNTGKVLKLTRKGFNMVLATSLVHFHPPKHHPRASRIIDEVLTLDPDNISCLLGRGYILQRVKRWADAADLFARVAELLPDDWQEGLRAKEEQAWCLSRCGDLVGGIERLMHVLEKLAILDNRDIDKARCAWRIGTSYWDTGDDKREDSYKYFITSLKYYQSYAPAFTSLGIYYVEFIRPPDRTRASKCFQKAFELDARETEAARRLAEGFAEDREWDLVEVIARRTIDGEGGPSALETAATAKHLPTNAWAWKAVGVVELVCRHYPRAIQALQVSIRGKPDDSTSWLRLGEAYVRAGRHAAALKALKRAQELDPEDWLCNYFIGETQRQTGQFQEAIDSFRSIIIEQPSEIGTLLSLAQAHLDLGRAERSTGFTSRAELSFIASVHVSLRMIPHAAAFRCAAWKTIADAFYALSGQTFFSNEVEVLEVVAASLALLGSTSSERLGGILEYPVVKTDGRLASLDVLKTTIVIHDHRLSLCTADRADSIWFDLSIAVHTFSASSHSIERCKAQALKYMMEAIRLDPTNGAYWATLGSMQLALQPKIAQHAFIKALEINPKDTKTWTNLGLLYLYHNDLELASDALLTAQRLDPAFTLTWVGHALVASACGLDRDALALFEHAMGLTADVPEAELEFASRIFASDGGSDRARDSESLLPAFAVLDRYCQRRPNDVSALHLLALVSERLVQPEQGIELIRRCISILETMYEETENAVVERQYCIANLNLGRMLMSTGDFEGAKEVFQIVQGLLKDEEDGAVSSLRAQALLGSALAMLKLGNMEESLAFFQDALNHSSDTKIRGHVTVLMAKALWLVGSEGAREGAKAHLLQCITADPDNVAAIATLASMGILTDDEGLVDAALSELLSMSIEDRRTHDPTNEVERLLTRCYLAQEDPRKALSTLQRAVHARPADRPARRALAEMLIQRGLSAHADAVLAACAPSLAAQREECLVHATALALSGQAAASKEVAQRGVFLAPSDQKNWRALAVVRALEASA